MSVDRLGIPTDTSILRQEVESLIYRLFIHRLNGSEAAM
jgi:hypothetical protein